MDVGTLAGIGAAFASLLIGLVLEGGNPASYISPSSFIIVVPSTVGVALACGLLKDMSAVIAGLKAAFLGKVKPVDDAIRSVVKFAETARREGLLALEEAAKTIEDPFLKKGIELAVDGTDPEELREILETEIASKKASDKVAAKFFADLGGFAPTLGIIGTVLGLVHVLESLSDPSGLGEKIAVAFIATLYGVVSANLVFLPIGKKLARLSEVEVHHMELMLEGIVSIQAGANPRVIEQKLLAYLTPAQRKSAEQAKAA